MKKKKEKKKTSYLVCLPQTPSIAPTRNEGSAVDRPQSSTIFIHKIPAVAGKSAINTINTAYPSMEHAGICHRIL